MIIIDALTDQGHVSPTVFTHISNSIKNMLSYILMLWHHIATIVLYVAHVKTVKLLCQVQNFVAIIFFECGWEWNKIAIESKLGYKKWNVGVYFCPLLVATISHGKQLHVGGWLHTAHHWRSLTTAGMNTNQHNTSHTKCFCPMCGQEIQGLISSTDPE